MKDFPMTTLVPLVRVFGDDLPTALKALAEAADATELRIVIAAQDQDGTYRNVTLDELFRLHAAAQAVVDEYAAVHGTDGRYRLALLVKALREELAATVNNSQSDR